MSYYGTVPLRADRREIRLFDIAPGNVSQPLRGRIRTVSLDSRPKYEALSYTWGSTADSTIIQLEDDTHVAITQNLARALRRIRLRTIRRTIWTDAVCINQQDDAERSSQVALMRQIYSQAESVTAWLGEPAHLSLYTLFKGWRAFHSLVSTLKKLCTYVLRPQSTFSLITRERQELESALANTTPRWADRIWVVQEFLLADHVYICFGAKTLQFDILLFKDMLTDSDMLVPQVRAFYERVSDIAYMQRFSNIDLSDAALWTTAADATDCRDRLFGLLGLVDDKEARLIVSSCNYSQDAAEVFARATFASIVAQCQFDVWELVTHSHGGMARLPTWALDFTVDRTSLAYPHLKFPMLQPLLQLTYAADESMPVASLSANGKVLTVKGSTLDYVREVQPLPPEKYQFAASDFENVMCSFLAVHKEETMPTGDRLLSTIPWCSKQLPELTAASLLVRGEKTTEKAILEAAFDHWDASTDFHPENRAYRRQNGTDDVGDFWNILASDAKVFVTTSGFIGLASSDVRADDMIVAVRGCRLPVILRRCGGDSTYHGLTYLYGVMDGELMEQFRGQAVELRELSLI